MSFKGGGMFMRIAISHADGHARSVRGIRGMSKPTSWTEAEGCGSLGSIETSDVMLLHITFLLCIHILRK